MNTTESLATHIINEKDRNRVVSEIEECQKRVLQTLVPTIIALGLIGTSPNDKNELITMGCTFAVLFSSSLYVASLSYKILRNASFLEVFESEDVLRNEIRWENALTLFRMKKCCPIITHAETTTAATIYGVLALTFVYVFARFNLIMAIAGGLILLFVATHIYYIFRFTSRKNKRKWLEVKRELQEEAADKG